MIECKICGGKNSCKYTPGFFNVLGREPLIKEDWKEIRKHVEQIHLPLVHKIVARARKRKQALKGE